MKVKAKNWVKTATGWHPTGETFEVEALNGLTGMVDVIEESADPAPESVPEDEQTDAVAPARKRGRKRTEE